MFFLAQNMPDPSLLQGNVQDIMAWVILAQVALYITTCIFLIRKLNHWEQKYDNLQKKTTKIALRSQQALAVLADLPPPEVEEDLEDEEEDR